ncbi:dihydrofolate reductase [Candidatus Gottesmanbacteria bacterium]|nr:dihydrofolate reductase [Candidatus Gottesmanbacteria bacterium]
MEKPTLSIIAALDESRAIGKNNKLLWHIPEDLKRFRLLTMNHPVIMGRKTFESIGRILPNRTNIIVTRNPSFRVTGAIVCNSLNLALEKARDIEKEEIFIIGGAQVYAKAIGKVDKLYLTLIEGSHDADAFFPPYDEFSTVVSKIPSTSGGYHYTFLELIR